MSYLCKIVHFIGSKCKYCDTIILVSKLLLPINVCKKSYSTSSSQAPLENLFELLELLIYRNQSK